MKFYIARASNGPCQENEPIKGSILECEYFSYSVLDPCKIWSIEINDLKELLSLTKKDEITICTSPYGDFSFSFALFDIDPEHDTVETERVSKELKTFPRIIIYDDYIEY